MKYYAEKFLSCEHARILKEKPLNDPETVYIGASPVINLYHSLLEGIDRETEDDLTENLETLIMQKFENYTNNSPYLLFKALYYLFRVIHGEMSYVQLMNRTKIDINAKLWIVSYTDPSFYGWAWEMLLKKEKDLNKWTTGIRENYFTSILYCHIIYCSTRENFYFGRIIESLKESDICIKKILTRNFTYLAKINYAYDFAILKPFLSEVINNFEISIMGAPYSPMIKKIIETYETDELPKSVKVALCALDFNNLNDENFNFFAFLATKHKIENKTINPKKYLSRDGLFPQILENPFACEQLLKLNIEAYRTIGQGKVCREGVRLALKNGWIIPQTHVSISTYCNILRYDSDTKVTPHLGYDDLSEVDTEILRNSRARRAFKNYVYKFYKKDFEKMPKRLVEIVAKDHKETGEWDLMRFLHGCLVNYPEVIVELDENILSPDEFQVIWLYFARIVTVAEVNKINLIRKALKNKGFVKSMITKILLGIDEYRPGDKLNLLIFLKEL